MLSLNTSHDGASPESAIWHFAQAVIHIHTLIEECEVVKLVSVLDPKTKEKKKVRS